ncbi:Fis family transcriptional regulator [Simiduia aestuariiviva]|uniref:Fis family transcriptional regulator n=1 Tax=Simiduia aestuariiviva TaxID=1510459 RepID=A0A839UPT0_9GAMM|nr:Fis family transcriptional regulator [Simiduia aestuariiviva]MBB3167385.1 hypothetical protein [Simiduia aestuariiviva]
MRKTDKKLDNLITHVLTDVCETTLKSFSGFQWLTHVVNYSSFPKSLSVICVFDTNASLNELIATDGHHEITKVIQTRLFEVGIDIDRARIAFDSEEDCAKHHNGKWTNRLAKYS